MIVFVSGRHGVHDRLWNAWMKQCQRFLNVIWSLHVGTQQFETIDECIPLSVDVDDRRETASHRVQTERLTRSDDVAYAITYGAERQPRERSRAPVPEDRACRHVDGLYGELERIGELASRMQWPRQAIRHPHRDASEWSRHQISPDLGQTFAVIVADSGCRRVVEDRLKHDRKEVVIETRDCLVEVDVAMWQVQAKVDKQWLQDASDIFLTDFIYAN